MNLTAYVFGSLNGSYSQAPLDYTQGFLSTLMPNAEPEMEIHRESL